MITKQIRSKRKEFPFFRNPKGQPFDRANIILNYVLNDHDAMYAFQYGEPGYTDPKAGILFANWNNVAKHLADALEAAGYELEWSDEWSIADNGKAYRDQPDGHGWERSYILTDDGEMLTRDDSHSEIIDERAIDQRQGASAAHQASLPSWITVEDLTEAGFEKHNGIYESGFHPGQTDDPIKIARELFADKTVERVVFRIAEVAQFSIGFEAWVQKETETA